MSQEVGDPGSFFQPPLRRLRLGLGNRAVLGGRRRFWPEGWSQTFARVIQPTLEGCELALATGRFSVGEDAFGLKAAAKPSQGFPQLLPCGSHWLWEGDHLAFSWLAPGHLLPDLGLREGGEAQTASGAFPGAGDGSHLGRAGSVEEGDGGRLVVPDLGSAIDVADDDGRGRRFLEGEAQVLAGDGFGRAVAA
jgi:hypothetical protein